MQHILTEKEFNQGKPLLFAWTTEPCTLGQVYEKQKKLNQQGFYTVVKDCEYDDSLFIIDVFQKTNSNDYI